MTINLNGRWKLYFYETGERTVNVPSQLAGLSSIPCTVPGNVELDLSRAGLLPSDLFMGENILTAEAFETYEWWYETSFEGIETSDQTVLHFEGVDCIAQYFLNGECIGQSDNMLIPVDLDITGKIQQHNTLHVKIASALLAENDMDATVYSMACAWRSSTLSTQIRKAPHSYGWDIMPRALSAGIWRDVSIQTHSECEFKQVYLVTDRLENNSAYIRFMYDIKLPHKYCKSDLKVHVHGQCGSDAFDFSRDMQFKAASSEFKVENPKLWWPYGYGDPNLYEVTVTLCLGGEVLATQNTTLGIRTVELYRKDIIEGRDNCFRFIVNRTDVVCKGSNWVPLNAYHSQDHLRYQKAFELVKDIGCNILRCWGGNVYEQQCFYDFCDQNGVMVWQDFSMACYLYPQTDGFAAQMKKEAEVVVKRLRQHPCIILWSGDNECDQIQMASATGQNPNKANKITREILPSVIMNHDLGRAYLESSPFVSDVMFNSKRYDLMPEDHLWGPRDYYKSDYYKNAKSHFVSETGYHGCPSVQSIKKFIEAESLWPCTGNRQWNLHSTDQTNSAHRVNLMIDQIRQLFDIFPDNLDDFSLASQISQAEAKKYFIERVRLATPRSGGVIWWNLLDGWPQFSDAVVDYYFDKKLAYDYIKRSQAPFSMMCGEISNLSLPIYAVNDTLKKASGHFSVINGETNELLLEGDYSVAENQRALLGKIPADYSEKRLIIIKWDGGFNHYISGFIPFDFDTYKKWLAIIKQHQMTTAMENR